MIAVSAEPPDEDSEFAALMPGIKRLANDKVNLYQQKPAKPIAIRNRVSDQQAPNDFSQLSFQQQGQISDSYFNHGINRKLQRRLRQGLITADGRLDLHGYTQQAAIKTLSNFLQEALDNACKLVIVIHGKGNRSEHHAVLKPLVHHWFSQNSSVLAWCPAQPKDGGSGASYVYLRSI